MSRANFHDGARNNGLTNPLSLHLFIDSSRMFDSRMFYTAITLMSIPCVQHPQYVPKVVEHVDLHPLSSEDEFNKLLVSPVSARLKSVSGVAELSCFEGLIHQNIFVQKYPAEQSTMAL